jgi:2-polyprenyl-6-hydroxyphenyl methylase / 3-demethylubiquinone-9 3-methyltransferase
MEFYSFENNNRTYAQALDIYRARIIDAEEVFSKFSHLFTDRNCPYCGSNRHTKHDLFHNKYKIDKCSTCASIFVNPVPPPEAIDFYYNNCKSNKSYINLLSKRLHTKDINISSKTKKLCHLINNYASEKKVNHLRILEVGCNSGVFLSELRQSLKILSPNLNYDLFGIDLDKTAVENNVDKRNDIQCISAEQYIDKSQEKFDFVVHYELLEHLIDPFNFTCSINSLLVSGGINFFTTPNEGGFDNVAIGYNKTRLLAHAIFPPMHLNAFSLSNISIISIRALFDIVSINTPGVFDADIVKLSYKELDKKSPFKLIKTLNNEQLGYFQSCLQLLKISSHMEVVLKKPIK